SEVAYPHKERWAPSTGPVSGVESLQLRQRQSDVILPREVDGRRGLGGEPPVIGRPSGGAFEAAGRQAVLLGGGCWCDEDGGSRAGGRGHEGTILARSKRPLVVTLRRRGD